MMKSALAGLSILVVASSACASHKVPHTAPDESLPHITWEIRTGGEEGEERIACQSAQPRVECTLAASSKERQELATIHLYLHAATQAVTYDGSVRLPFLDGAADVGRVSATVTPGSTPQGPTIAGVITSKPGTYTMTVALKVKHGGNESPPIDREVKVIVREAAVR